MVLRPLHLGGQRLICGGCDSTIHQCIQQRRLVRDPVTFLTCVSAVSPDQAAELG